MVVLPKIVAYSTILRFVVLITFSLYLQTANTNTIMCFTSSKDEDLEKAKRATRDLVGMKIKNQRRFKASYALSAFQNDYLPVFRNSQELEFFSWGFIQPTSYDNKDSAEIKYMTANAKCETIFEKPLYKNAIHERRCLIMIDGFYEWRHAFKKKYPHYIYHKSDPVFFIGGIWNEFANVETGEIKETVSMITTVANPMMEIIHNNKKRMPFIMDANSAFEWLNPNLTQSHLSEMMQPFDEVKMAYHTIGKKLYPNSVETIEPVTYPELSNEQRTLF